MAVRIHVHEDARVLDGIQELVELVQHAGPLQDTLCAMCRRLAQLCRVDVVSVYIRERDTLVMRGNVGFVPDVVGTVRLGLHDGLTGMVAERRRPITVAVAQHDARYKHVEGIGEEQFPAYLGIPLVRDDDVVGVLVLQRRQPRAFTAVDVEVASSLTAPFQLVIERERSYAGRSLVAGRAIGPALLLGDGGAVTGAAPQRLEADLAAATARLGAIRSPGIARAIDNLRLVVLALRDADPLAALERMPYRTTAGAKPLAALLDERRTELAALLAFLAADLAAGWVLVVRRLGALLALEAVSRGAAALIVGDTITPDAAEILQAAGLPAVEIPELVDRLDGGELLDVDAIHGSVRILD